MAFWEKLNKQQTKTVNYWVEPWRKGEAVLVFLLGAIFSAFIVWVFYASWFLLLPAIPIGFLALPFYKKIQAEKKKEHFLMQVKDMLYYLSVSLSAGKSLESAFVDASASLRMQYGQKTTNLLREIDSLNGRVRIREPVEVVLTELAEKTSLEDVRSLADVIAICKRTGGNLVEVMQHSVKILREKMDIHREMETAWAAKKLEQRILCVSPVFLVLFIKLGSGDFLDPLYTTVAGRMVMTLALVLVGVGFFIGEKVMKVKI